MLSGRNGKGFCFGKTPQSSWYLIWKAWTELRQAQVKLWWNEWKLFVKWLEGVYICWNPLLELYYIRLPLLTLVSKFAYDTFPGSVCRQHCTAAMAMCWLQGPMAIQWLVGELFALPRTELFNYFIVVLFMSRYVLVQLNYEIWLN